MAIYRATHQMGLMSCGNGSRPWGCGNSQGLKGPTWSKKASRDQKGLTW